MPVIKWCVYFSVLFYSLNSIADERLTSAENFWKEFRMAVVNKSNDKIIALTYFPFKVRKVDDSQPQQLYKQNKFSDIFQQLLKQQLFVKQGKEFISTSMRDLIQDSPEFSQKNFLTPNLFRFHQFEFEEINGNWYFVLAYLEE